jgi:hypothetical protein
MLGIVITDALNNSILWTPIFLNLGDTMLVMDAHKVTVQGPGFSPQRPGR